MRDDDDDDSEASEASEDADNDDGISEAELDEIYEDWRFSGDPRDVMEEPDLQSFLEVLAERGYPTTESLIQRVVEIYYLGESDDDEMERLIGLML